MFPSQTVQLDYCRCLWSPLGNEMWTCLVTSMALPCLLASSSSCITAWRWPLVKILQDCLAASPLTGLLHIFSLINHIHSLFSQPISNDHFTHWPALIQATLTSHHSGIRGRITISLSPFCRPHSLVSTLATFRDRNPSSSKLHFTSSPSPLTHQKAGLDGLFPAYKT